MRFYLGVHEPAWLSRSSVPLFVSDRRLRRRVKMPVATCRWALDSGGFTELSMHGQWITSAKIYAERAARYMQEIGGLDFAAVQDWMCEPFMLDKTGLTIAEHQTRTINSYLHLQGLAPDVPWLPVLQGWTRQDYLSHVEQYAAAGVVLADVPRVGVGSVCRRQSTAGAAHIVRELAGLGLSLHLFGYKRQGLPRVHDCVASSDSMAWSYRARRMGHALEGCTHKTCSNCFKFAMLWRDETIANLRQCAQMEMF